MTFRSRFTLAELKDLALVGGLVFWLVKRGRPALWVEVAGIGVLLIGVVLPRILTPVARVWFGLGEVLARVVSPVVVGGVFYVVVVPLGVLRRAILGEHVMRVREFRAGDSSVFVTREHRYVASDFTHQF